MTIALAKVLGIFFIIVGCAVALRRRYFLPVFASFAKERLTRAIIALSELLVGLFLVVAYNEWSPVPAAVITVIGWMAVIEGSLYLLLPDDMVDRFISAFNTPTWYLAGGLLSVAIGIYLAAFGFGWL